MSLRRILTIGLPLALVAAIAVLSMPPSLDAEPAAASLPDDIDGWLRLRESAADARYGLVPGTEKRIRWQSPGERTPIVIVNLHGFSATRAELAPLPERLADALGANLFETRLRGHGRRREALAEVTAEDWLDDAAEALRIAAALGDHVVVIGTSTGATLALAMHDHALMAPVRQFILVSPNLRPADPKSIWVTRPGGKLLLMLLAGESRSWTPHNEQQARYWSTTYPTAAAVEVMRLVDRAQQKLRLPMSQELLMLVAPGDEVVSPQAARDAYARADSPRKALVEFTASQDPKHHILAGDIMSPQTTDAVLALILEFLRRR